MTKIDILKAVREEAKGFTSTREAGFNFIFDSAVSVEISDRKASKLAEDIINENYEACAKRFGKDILETLLADIRTFTAIEEKMPTYELWADTFDVSEANKDGFIAQALKQGFAYEAERAEGLDCMWTITLRKAPEGDAPTDSPVYISAKYVISEMAGEYHRTAIYAELVSRGLATDTQHAVDLYDLFQYGKTGVTEL